MAIKKKPDEPGPSKAYLVSFGDTMTTLLAFFIVLCSLAEDQTGANLHNGTGSFVRALDGLGLPGAFSGETTSKAVQLQATSPLYLVPAPDQETDQNASGPDDNDNGMRVIDREKEEYQRFLNEMDRMFQVDPLPETNGEATFDFFKKLNPQPPYLPDSYNSILAQVVPLTRRKTHRVEFIVWATTPSRSAWQRAAEEAGQIAKDIATSARLTPEQRDRLQAIGKPWMYTDIKRPVISIVVRKVSPATP